MPITLGNHRILPENRVLAGLTEAKIDELENVCGNWGGERTGISDVPQGYTYMGQFIAHEMIPRPGVNLRSWKIDLDSVYPDFFDSGKIDQDNGKFRFAAADSKFAADLCRHEKSRKANIPEFRNDDQMLIAQIHLAIQLFHNAVIEKISASPLGTLSKDSSYTLARDYVRASFQRVVMDDFLQEVCCQPVYDALWRNSQPEIIRIDDTEPSLPPEISDAVARFGHTMARDVYTLNTKPEGMAVPLSRLFELSGENNPAFEGIPKELNINWKLFFNDEVAVQAKSAKRIDPSIVESMLKPPNPTNPNLIVKNLQAGIRSNVASGQELARLVIEELARQAIHSNEAGDNLGIREELGFVAQFENYKKALKKINLLHQTPLWLYILIEAASPETYGRTLGPLGSLLIIETFKNAVRIPGVKPYKELQDNFEEIVPELKCLRAGRILELLDRQRPI